MWPRLRCGPRAPGGAGPCAAPGLPAGGGDRGQGTGARPVPAGSSCPAPVGKAPALEPLLPPHHFVLCQKREAAAALCAADLNLTLSKAKNRYSRGEAVGAVFSKACLQRSGPRGRCYLADFTKFYKAFSEHIMTVLSLSTC